jgi:crotonobetainyl-CoA:carnitine CoA-transferase CaiB-like acyl-CoA transferase
MGGVTQATGYSGEPPFRLPGFPAHYIAGLNAALAVAGAVLGAESGTESGAEIHISMEHAYMHHWVRHIQQWACSGHDLPREPRGEGRQGFPHTVRAADGWIYLLALYTDWESLAAFLELDQFATSEWGNPGTREGRWEEIEPHFNRAIERRPRYQWLADAAEYGYTFAPVHEMSELASSPQAEAREAFTPFEWDGTKLLTPSLPFKEQNGEAGSRYVPRKGEHTLEVLTEWGLEKTHVAKLIGDGLAGEGAEANLQRRRS